MRLLRADREDCLKALMHAAVSKDFRDKDRIQILFALQLLEKNWGEDILNDAALAKMLKDMPSAKLPMPPAIAAGRVPGPPTEELVRQLEKSVEGYKKLPFDPLERLPDKPREAMKRNREITKRSLSPVIRSLIERNSKEAKALVVRLLEKTNNPSDIAACLQYLEKCAARDNYAQFVKFLSHTPRYDATVRYRALQGLFAAGDKRSTAYLGDYLAKFPTDPICAAIIVGAAERKLRAAEPWLVAYIGRDGKYMNKAIAALGVVGGEAAKRFLMTRAKTETKPRTFELCARALISLRSDGVYDVTRGRLESKDPDMAVVAVRTLGRVGKKDAVPDLKALSATAAGNKKLRAEITYSLAILGDRDSVKMLTDSVAADSGRASDWARCATALSECDGAAIAAVLDGLGRDATRVRAAQAVEEVLVRRGEEVKSNLLDYLEKESARKYHKGVELACLCIVKSGAKDKRTLATLKKVYADSQRAPAASVEKCAALRKEIALYLTAVTGKKWKYTVLRPAPFY